MEQMAMSTTTIHALDTQTLESLSCYLNVIDLITIIIAGSKIFTKKVLLSVTNIDFKLLRFWPDYCVDSVLRLCENARSARVTMAENDVLYPLETILGRRRLFACGLDFIYSPTSMPLLTSLDIRVKDCFLLRSNMQQTFPLLKHFTVECRGDASWTCSIAQHTSKLPSNLETLRITLIPNNYPGLSAASPAADSRPSRLDATNLVRWLPQTLDVLEIAGNGLVIVTEFMINNEILHSWPPIIRCLTLGAVTNLRFVNNLPSTLEILSVGTTKFFHTNNVPRVSLLPIRLSKLTMTKTIERSTFAGGSDIDTALLIIDSKLPSSLQSIHIDDALIVEQQGLSADGQFLYPFEHNHSLRSISGAYRCESKGRYPNLLPIITEAIISNNPLLETNTTEDDSFYLDGGYIGFDNQWNSSTIRRAKSLTLMDVHQPLVFNSDVIIPFRFTTLSISFVSLRISDGVGGCTSEQFWQSMPRTLNSLKMGSIELLPSGEAAAWLPNSITSIKIRIINDELDNVQLKERYATLGAHLPSSLRKVSFTTRPNIPCIYGWIHQMQHRVAYTSLRYVVKNCRRSIDLNSPHHVVDGKHPFQIIAASCSHLNIFLHSQCIKYCDVDGQLDTTKSAFSSLPVGIQSLKISLPAFTGSENDAMLIMDHNDCAAIPHSLIRFHIDATVQIVRFHPSNLGMAIVGNHGLEFLHHIPQSIIDLQIHSIYSIVSSADDEYGKTLIQEAIMEYYSEPHWVTGCNNDMPISPSPHLLESDHPLLQWYRTMSTSDSTCDAPNEEAESSSSDYLEIPAPTPSLLVPSNYAFSITTDILAAFK